MTGKQKTERDLLRKETALEKELRANLARRKQQTRARATNKPTSQPTAAEAKPPDFSTKIG